MTCTCHQPGQRKDGGGRPEDISFFLIIETKSAIMLVLDNNLSWVAAEKVLQIPKIVPHLLIWPILQYILILHYLPMAMYILNYKRHILCTFMYSASLTKCWFNAGPASQTVGQYWPSIGWMCRVCCPCVHWSFKCRITWRLCSRK